MSRSQRPLTPAVFHVLLALAEGPQHGYKIMQAARDTAGTSARMGPGTVYGSIQRLLDAGLVRELEADPGDTRRRTFEMTAAGRDALQVEARRLLHLADLVRTKRLASGTSDE